MSTTPPPLPPTTIQPPPSPAKSGIPLPLIIVGVVGAVVVGIAVLAGLAAPQLLRMRKKGEQVVAMSNGKNLLFALNDFSTEYGGFPDRETAKAVTESTGSLLNLNGDTANDYFRQLIAAAVVKSEDPFWIKTHYSPVPPDNNMTGNEALKAGEVGWGYVMNGTQALSRDGPSRDDPNQIILVTPLSNSQTNGAFDPLPLDGKAVVVYLDSSVNTLPIGPDGKIALGNSRTLLDSGVHTSRGAGFTPVIKAPKKR
jgi:hypothetical protein